MIPSQLGVAFVIFRFLLRPSVEALSVRRDPKRHADAIPSVPRCIVGDDAHSGLELRQRRSQVTAFLIAIVTIANGRWFHRARLAQKFECLAELDLCVWVDLE